MDRSPCSKPPRCGHRRCYPTWRLVQSRAGRCRHSEKSLYQQLLSSWERVPGGGEHPIEYVDLRDEGAVRAAIRPSTRAIWIESPTNPCMNLVDLGAIAGMARAPSVLTICDNTFLSPYFQRPLDLGVDIVLHSTTKYINGHSDVVGGAIVDRKSTR